MFSVQEKMKGKNKLVPRLLGVTKDSVLRLDEKTKEILKTWPLTTVRRWGASPNTFTLDFGDYSDQYYSVQTTEAEQILQLIAGYIDIILKKVWDGPLGCGDKYLRSHCNLVRKVVGLWRWGNFSLLHYTISPLSTLCVCDVQWLELKLTTHLRIRLRLNMCSLATVFSIFLKDVLRQWLSIKLCKIFPLLI